MTFGANSNMFREWPRAVFGGGQTSDVLPAAYAGLGADTINVALFNDTTTPSKDAARTSTGYNTGVWVTGNEVTDATNWVAGGRALAGKTFDTTNAGVYMFDATDLAGGGAVTLTNAFGCLVYDNTITAGTGGVAKQGITFHSFGGAQTVTAGTFTIVWHANGLFRISV
jgi:hypothetical protein